LWSPVVVAHCCLLAASGWSGNSVTSCGCARSPPRRSVCRRSGHQLWLRMRVSLSGFSGVGVSAHQLWLRMTPLLRGVAGQWAVRTSCGCAARGDGRVVAVVTSCGCAWLLLSGCVGVGVHRLWLRTGFSLIAVSGGDVTHQLVAHRALLRRWVGMALLIHQLWLRMSASSSRCSCSTRRESRERRP
jgi:hypothetical protein